MWRYLAVLAFGVSAGWLIGIARRGPDTVSPPKRVHRSVASPLRPIVTDDRPYEYREADALQRDQEALEPDPPAGATAICSDLSYSFDKKKENACHDHKGILKWIADIPPHYK